MRIFISQPMNGFTTEEIKAERKRIEDIFKGNDFIVSFIDRSKVDERFMDNPSIWYLGESIKHMQSADLVVGPTVDWPYRGCIVEMRVADLYSIPTCRIPMYPDKKMPEVGDENYCF